MINPAVIYFSAAIALTSGYMGWTVRSWKCEADQTKALALADKREQEMRSEIDKSAMKYEEIREIIIAANGGRAQMVREIYKDVEVPADCAVSPAAVRLLEDSIRDANARTASISGEVVSTGADAAEAAR